MSKQWKLDLVHQVLSGGDCALASLQLSKDGVPFTGAGSGEDGDSARAILDAICKLRGVKFSLSGGDGHQSFNSEISTASVCLTKEDDPHTYTGKAEHRRYDHAVALAIMQAIDSAQS